MSLQSPLQPDWKKTRKEIIEERLERKKTLLKEAERNKKKWEKKQEGKEVNKFLEQNPNLKDDLNFREEDFGTVNENLGNDEDIYREIKRPKPSLLKIIKNKFFDWNLKRRSKKLAKITGKLKRNRVRPTIWEFHYGYSPRKFGNYIFPGEIIKEGEDRNSKRKKTSISHAKEIVRTVRYWNFLFKDFIALDTSKHSYWWFDDKDPDFKELILRRGKRYNYITDAKTASIYTLVYDYLYRRLFLGVVRCYAMLSAADILWFCKTPQMHYYIRLYNPDVLKSAIFCYGVVITIVATYFLCFTLCTLTGRHTLLSWFRTRFVIFMSSSIANAMCCDRFMNLECFTYYWAIYFPFSMYFFYTYTNALWGTEEEILYENFLELFTVWFTYSPIFILPKKSTPFDIEMDIKGFIYNPPKDHIDDPHTLHLPSMYVGPEEKVALPPEAEHLVRLIKQIGPTGLKEKKEAVLAETERVKRLEKAYYLWYNLEGLRGEGTLQTLMTFKRHKYYWRVFWNKGFWVD